MRIQDLLEHVIKTQILATKRFKKDYQEFVRAFPTFKDTFAEFIKHKHVSPQEPFGKKDYPFKGKLFNGWEHAHIVFGKAMVIYKSSPEQILLAAVVDHLSVEGTGNRIQALAKYVKDLGMQDFVSLMAHEEPEHDHMLNHKPAVMDLFYHMAAHESDQDLLRDFAQGKNDHVLEFLGVAVPDVQVDHMDLKVLRTWAATALAHVAQP